MLTLQSILFAILMWMAWQDFKFRAVYWWLFPLLLIVLVMVKLKEHIWILSQDLLYNSAFLAVQMLFLTVYFSIKEQRWVNIFKAYFGLGDLLFLCCLTVYFSFFNYILFYVVSLFTIILMSLLTQVVSRKANPKIPLAGWQAILLLFFILVEGYYERVDLTTDLGLVNYLGF